MDPYEKLLMDILTGSTHDDRLPDKVIITDDACIMWFNGKKTVVRRHPDDEPDQVTAFLWCYYLANCRVSRHKAKEFIEHACKEAEEKRMKRLARASSSGTSL